VSYEEAQYEGYGPGGAALIIDVLTDNKNRTVGELRHLLEKHGGNLAAANAVAWMFTKKGYIVIEKSKADEERLMSAVLDASADDLQDDVDNRGVFRAPDAFPAVHDAVAEGKQVRERRLC
jgi:transcriptional/translational regulatory protein YebC/TACO1